MPDFTPVTHCIDPQKLIVVYGGVAELFHQLQLSIPSTSLWPLPRLPTQRRKPRFSSVAVVSEKAITSFCGQLIRNAAVLGVRSPSFQMPLKRVLS